jgi:hypothetical protein
MTHQYSTERLLRKQLSQHRQDTPHAIKTEPCDWAVTVHRRVPAPYKTPVPCELITFTFSHANGEPETLTDCPFEAGVSLAELALWLSNADIASAHLQ